MSADSAATPPHATQTLDLRTTKCPLNFVKTKLALEKMNPGEILAVEIDSTGDSALNIPNSVVQEGYTIVHQATDPDGIQTLWIEKPA